MPTISERAYRTAYAAPVEALLAFGATLLSLRLAGALLRRRQRGRQAPQLGAWAASLTAYGLASAALAWGSAAGWDDRTFRVYYLCGGLLTVPLLGLGSLLLAGRRRVVAPVLLYCGLAAGVAVAAPISPPVAGTAIPAAQDHLELVPARIVAIAGNGLGTLAVVVVALLTLRRRPLANILLLAGVALAASGSALAGLGATPTALFVALAALVLYASFVAPATLTALRANKPLLPSSHR